MENNWSNRCNGASKSLLQFITLKRFLTYLTFVNIRLDLKGLVFDF